MEIGSEICAYSVIGPKAYHGREHASVAPHIQTVVIFLEVHQQLGTLEVSRRNADIVCCPWVIKLGQTPIDQTKLGAKSDMS